MTLTRTVPDITIKPGGQYGTGAHRLIKVTRALLGAVFSGNFMRIIAHAEESLRAAAPPGLFSA